MKKFLVLFLSLAVFTACSNDDDTDSNSPDPILGTWALVQVSAPLNTQFCMDKESTITFNADKTLSSTFYLTEANCTATTSPGNWSNKGNSIYTITVPMMEGDLQGTVNFSSANKFTFTSLAGVFTFEK